MSKEVEKAAFTAPFAATLDEAVTVLKQGGLILYPTDTVWGIGCDATNERAVQRIYALKKRADAKAMLVLVDREEKLSFYMKEVPPMAWELVRLADKPLTIIYPDALNLAPSLLAEDGSIGIRVTREAFSKALCARFNKPVVSTSANISGEPSPAFFQAISAASVQGVDYVVNYRREETAASRPSSIIKLGVDGTVSIIRP
jgi:L-threonylcarbamoyladenylate synthase